MRIVIIVCNIKPEAEGKQMAFTKSSRNLNKCLQMRL